MNEQDFPRELRTLGSARAYPGLERLICAALADPQFAAELLADPAVALERELVRVRLSSVERKLAGSIKGASDIHDFAARLHAQVQRERLHEE